LLIGAGRKAGQHSKYLETKFLRLAAGKHGARDTFHSRAQILKRKQSYAGAAASRRRLRLCLAKGID